MKALSLGMMMILVPMTAAAGGDSSAGGGGGQLQIASGFAPGQFSITGFSSETGVVAEALKYYVADEGVRTENDVMVWYNIAGQDSNNAFIHSKDVQSGDATYFQVNFQIAYADLLEIRSGFNDQAQVTMIRFQGMLAQDLYDGMEKSGLKPVGMTLDPATHAVVGKIFSDDRVYCEKRPAGVACSLTFGNIKPRS